MWGIDGDEEYHTDFSKKRGVMTLPKFALSYSDLPEAYDDSVHDLPICKMGLKYLTNLYKFLPEDLSKNQHISHQNIITYIINASYTDTSLIDLVAVTLTDVKSWP